MTTIISTRAGARLSKVWLTVLILLALLAAAGIGAAMIGSRRSHLPAPFTLAPNGRIVVTDGASLLSLAADGTARRELASIPGGADSLSMSPEGTRVAYQTHSGDRGVLHVIGVDGSSPVTVTLPGDLASDPIGWSPDGQLLTFAGIDAGREHIYIVGADGTGLKAVDPATSDPAPSLWQPLFSPDGRWIAFTAQPASGGPARLFLMRPDGTGGTVLPPQAVLVGNGNVPPSWQPDPSTERIVYQGPSGIRLLDVSTGKDIPVGSGTWPVWAPDGRHLAFWNGGPAVVSLADILAGHPVATGVFARVPGGCPDSASLTGTAVCSPVAWSPDGTRLIAGDIANPGLLVAASDGAGQPSRIPLDVATRDAAHVAWQPIGG